MSKTEHHALPGDYEDADDVDRDQVKGPPRHDNPKLLRTALADLVNEGRARPGLYREWKITRAFVVGLLRDADEDDAIDEFDDEEEPITAPRGSADRIAHLGTRALALLVIVVHELEQLRSFATSCRTPGPEAIIVEHRVGVALEAVKTLRDAAAVS